MPRWVAFSALTLVVLVILLLATRASARVVDDLTTRSSDCETLEAHDGANRSDEIGPMRPSAARVSKRTLFANVAGSHCLFAAVLIAGIVFADIPPSSLGVETDPLTDGEAIAVGTAVGAAIAVANLLTGAIADALEIDPSRPLRELLAPESTRGWLALLIVVLPVVAGFEELLFRGILIGAFAAGFELSPWILTIGSSVAFAAGHGAQGRLGIAVTGGLGFVFAAVFIWTGSLLVVVIAHYVVNAAEFVLVEGIGYEPFGG